MSRRRFVATATLAALAALGLASSAIAAPVKKKRPGRKATRKPVREAIGPGRANVTVPPAAPPPSPVELAEREAPQTRWRSYEVVSQFKLAPGRKPVRLWLPLPSDQAGQYQRLGEHGWEGNAERVRILRDSQSGRQILAAEWNAASTCQLNLLCKVTTRDRRFDITRRNQPAEAPEVLRDNLLSVPGLEIGEPSREVVREILVRLKDPLAQAHAIYDWVVENTRFDPRASTSGNGDPTAFITNTAYAGSDTDISGLFVLLARSAGIPARRVYGWRVDASDIVPSLGQKPGSTPTLHCRAEFYTHGYGWIPVDPADVRKALAMDADQLDNRKREILRKLLFGFWEMNWISLGATEVGDPDGVRPIPGTAPPGLLSAWLEVGGQASAPGEALSLLVRPGAAG